MKTETFFVLNRFYLLFALLFTSIVPTFDLSILKENFTEFSGFMEPIIISVNSNINTNSTGFNFINTLIYIYLAGVALFFIRFIFQFIQLYFVAKKTKKTSYKNIQYQIIENETNSFSFFKLIFINKKITSPNDIENIIAHEHVHVQQFHSIDLIILEIITIIQWFNPVVWLFRKSIKEIHEYLADDGILSRGVDKVYYQQLLLNQTFGTQLNELTNNFNKTLIKRRFIMMTKSKTAKSNKLKLLISLPILAFLFVFATISKADAVISVPTENTNVGNQDPMTQVEKMPEFVGGMEALIQYISKNIKYPKSAAKAGVEGKVFVSFFVNEDGAISGVVVEKGVSPELDKEALRVISKMPKWTPGENQGKPVKVALTLPIQFKLDATK
ncbi:MAG: hypothetical protein A2W98_09570 [Bacteroidetes bacterium GWF2_33_38]|nr:MAG: hypothetical protein A2W98_09570 [Bacteroidetes bacterium GWF2_33_38]OFY68394.1 MAG: hypothetical protein A2265_08720 [Bacteroidetes bacterium RIFOXYA12_FULL_33_9]OFY88472.1 MAG: hypothetical protein A2236_03655 [Bacteroidetes bacterium RIFOXYA2_FULL_33_7]